MKSFHENSYYMMTVVTYVGKTSEVVQCKRRARCHVSFVRANGTPIKMMKLWYGHDCGLWQGDTLYVADAEETDRNGNPLEISRFEIGETYRMHAVGVGIGYGQQLATCIRVTPNFVRLSVPGRTLTFKKRGCDPEWSDCEFIHSRRGDTEYYANAEAVQ